MFLPSNITLQFGDTGEFVAELQRRLSLINLFNEAFINATFDGNTVNAVKSFQSMQGLRVDGIAGPETLRRLNGMISGDTSSTTSSSSNQEEEQNKVRATALMVDAIFADAQQQPIDPTLMAAPEEKREAPAAEKPSVPVPPPRNDLAQAQDTQAQQQNMELLKQQEMARQQQQPPQPTAEELQARLMQQQAEMARLQEQLNQQQAPKLEQAAKPKEEPKAKEEQAVVERKPLSAMLQKLVDYIESKLPRSVVDEVKSIGLAMARAGVREAAMPTEAVARAPELEAGRGAQQQQQRG
ncbi:MAG: peptidoglycan-binding protein [Alphaproteobacteria bacterium]|nr:peptidoglycan-binding protein [Alphaproteobacteria bacterium]